MYFQPIENPPAHLKTNYMFADFKLQRIIIFGTHFIENFCTKGLNDCALMSRKVIV